MPLFEPRSLGLFITMIVVLFFWIGVLLCNLVWEPFVQARFLYALVFFHFSFSE